MLVEKDLKEVFGAMDDFFKDLEENDLTDFYHMNKYTMNRDDKNIKITYTIPGADKEDLKVKIVNDTVFVSAKKNDVFSGLKDAFGVPSNVDIGNISSQYKNGILDIVLPLLGDNKDRENIEITVE
jgi:HSP20 family molecular chaperone IbpA